MLGRLGVFVVAGWLLCGWFADWLLVGVVGCTRFVGWIVVFGIVLTACWFWLVCLVFGWLVWVVDCVALILLLRLPNCLVGFVLFISCVNSVVMCRVTWREVFYSLDSLLVLIMACLFWCFVFVFACWGLNALTWLLVVCAFGPCIFVLLVPAVISV